MCSLLSEVENIIVVESIIEKISFICGAWFSSVRVQLRTLLVVLEHVGDLLQWVLCLIAGLGSSLLDCFGLASLS